MIHGVFSAIFCITWNIKSLSTLSWQEVLRLPCSSNHSVFTNSCYIPIHPQWGPIQQQGSSTGKPQFPCERLIWSLASLVPDPDQNLVSYQGLGHLSQHHKNGRSAFSLSQTLNQLLSLSSGQKPYLRLNFCMECSTSHTLVMQFHYCHAVFETHQTFRLHQLIRLTDAKLPLSVFLLTLLSVLSKAVSLNIFFQLNTILPEYSTLPVSLFSFIS